jgi:hypothetical protein
MCAVFLQQSSQIRSKVVIAAMAMNAPLGLLVVVATGRRGKADAAASRCK